MISIIYMLGSFALLISQPKAGEFSLQEPAGRRVPTTLEVTVALDGDMTLPARGNAKPQRLAMTGTSRLVYDERPLPPDDDAEQLVRIYRRVEIERSVDGRRQTADIRKEVRRMVVLRSIAAKSPFSPDGPLTWNEIDVVKHDVFAPVLAAGLLPAKAVKPGDSWIATAAAVRELTDLERVDKGELKIAFVRIVDFDGKQRARLSLAGTIRGVDSNGPARHTLDGTAYFDLESQLLTYITLKGSHELLDGDGKPSGRIDGRFTLTRTISTTLDLSDEELAKLPLQPTAENTRLLYDNPELGIRFVHPRRWRVGAVQGRQITLDGPNAAGILVTLETVKTLPTAEDYRKESIDFIAKQKGRTENPSKIVRSREKPPLDRFGYDAELGKEKLRMEYAVAAAAAGGGATLAARLPRADAAVLAADFAVILDSLEFPAK